MELSRILVYFMLKTLLMTWVTGTGHIALRLIEYNHISRGKLLNGKCCGGIVGDCATATCDPYFLIQVTEKNHVANYINLTYQTDSLKDVETIHFSTFIGSTSSFVNESIPIWPGTVEIRVNVMDNNSDTSTRMPDGVIGNASVLLSRTKEQLLHKDTEFVPLEFNGTNFILKAELNVRCDTYYNYDAFCGTFCEPADNATQHIACDEQGRKHCSPGWGGDPKSGCLTLQCSPNPCQNGGNCSSLNGVATCLCAPGFSGQLCYQKPTSPSLITTSKQGGVTPASSANSGGQTGVTSASGGGQTSVTSASSGGQAGVTSASGGGQAGVTSASGGGQTSVTSASSGGQAGVTSASGGGQAGVTSASGGGQAGVTSASGGGHTGVTSASSGGQAGVTSNASGKAGATPSTGAGGQGDDGDNTGAIAGGVVGGLAALALLSLLLFLLWRRKREKEKVDPAKEEVGEAEQEDQAEKAPQKAEAPAAHDGQSSPGQADDSGHSSLEVAGSQ